MIDSLKSSMLLRVGVNRGLTLIRKANIDAEEKYIKSSWRAGKGARKTITEERARRLKRNKVERRVE